MEGDIINNSVYSFLPEPVATLERPRANPATPAKANVEVIPYKSLSVGVLKKMTLCWACMYLKNDNN